MRNGDSNIETCLNVSELTVTKWSKLQLFFKKVLCFPSSSKLCHSPGGRGLKKEKRQRSGSPETTGGTVSDGGKQQRYKNFCLSGQKEEAGAAGGESTSIRPENLHHPEIRASRDPGKQRSKRSRVCFKSIQ